MKRNGLGSTLQISTSFLKWLTINDANYMKITLWFLFTWHKALSQNNNLLEKNSEV